jgi:hypothetical protein
MTSSEADGALVRLLGPVGLGCGKTLGWDGGSSQDL